MDIQETNIESVTMSDILQLSSWDRPRTTTELLGFIARRESEIEDDIDRN
jgi:hypothetical protein